MLENRFSDFKPGKDYVVMESIVMLLYQLPEYKIVHVEAQPNCALGSVVVRIKKIEVM